MTTVPPTQPPPRMHVFQHNNGQNKVGLRNYMEDVILRMYHICCIARQGLKVDMGLPAVSSHPHPPHHDTILPLNDTQLSFCKQYIIDTFHYMTSEIHFPKQGPGVHDLYLYHQFIVLALLGTEETLRQEILTIQKEDLQSEPVPKQEAIIITKRLNDLLTECIKVTPQVLRRPYNEVNSPTIVRGFVEHAMKAYNNCLLE